MTVWVETAKSLKDGDAKLEGLIIASQLPNQRRIIIMSFLTPEEMLQKKKTRKMWMYISLFVFTIALIAGTTLLTYHM
jgi:hypothetical protein